MKTLMWAKKARKKGTDKEPIGSRSIIARGARRRNRATRCCSIRRDKILMRTANRDVTSQDDKVFLFKLNQSEPHVATIRQELAVPCISRFLSGTPSEKEKWQAAAKPPLMHRSNALHVQRRKMTLPLIV